MKEYFNKINNTNILASIIFVIIGMILIFNPEGTLEIISYLVGALFIMIGAIKIVNYFKDKKDVNTYFQDDLVYGIMMIVIGIIVLVGTGFIASIFRAIVALWIIYSGTLRLVYALRFKVFGEYMWIVNTILSIVIIGCGVFILFSPGILIATVGVLILIYSITDLVEAFIFSKSIKKFGE